MPGCPGWFRNKVSRNGLFLAPKTVTELGLQHRRRKYRVTNTLRQLVFLLACTVPALAGDNKAPSPGAKAILWRDPTDIASRNLLYGSGGEGHQPRGPFTFIQEDLEGSNPKFDVRDQDGVKWKVKLGAEARPEVAATRLVWAAGYFTNEDYFVADLQVQALPHLHRGQNLVGPDGTMHNARLKRSMK